MRSPRLYISQQEELAREDSGLDSSGDDGETADGGQRQEAEESIGDSGDDGETADGGQRQVAEESCTEPFPKDHPFLVKLRDYLESRHGKGRSKSEANQISAEVSRYLHFSQPAQLNQLLLIDPEAMNRYLTSIEQAPQRRRQSSIAYDRRLTMWPSRSVPLTCPRWRRSGAF